MPATEHLYLDANATTPSPEAVRAAVDDALQRLWGNPSSQHAAGRAARAAIRTAREQIATLVGAEPGRITFTSGGSEALNMWLHGTLAYRKNSTSPNIIPIFFVSAGEHPAVRVPLAAWATAGLIEIVTLPTDRWGRVSAATLAATLAAAPPGRAAGIALIAAHNETGAVQDLAALAAVAQAAAVPLLFDGVQWTGKLPLDLAALGDVAWAISGHKFGSPKGIGALIAPARTLAAPLIAGGPQEHRRRAGTENVPGIVGMGVAAQLAAAALPQQVATWQRAIKGLLAAIVDVWPEAICESDPATGLPQTVLLRFPGAVGVEIVQRLDLEGIAASSGSACASGAARASETLMGLGWSAAEASACVRFSLPPQPQPQAAARVAAVLTALRRDMAGSR